MYLGRYQSQISSKGRISLPAKFKKQLGTNFIIARWYENCLVLVGLSSWQKFTSRFALENEVVTKPIRSVERYILSTAFEVEADDQGRFVVPPFLRSSAGLNEKVIFLGLRERIELWDETLWQKEEDRVKNEAETMLEKISKQRKR